MTPDSSPQSSPPAALTPRRIPYGLLRVVGMVEGVSFLLLLGVAMPLKYLAGQPLAVKYVGWVHGLLFVALMLVIAWAWARGMRSGLAVLALLASVLPFGPFVIDSRLKAAQRLQG